MNVAEITIRPVRVEEIRALRHRILRAGLPFSEATFEKDDEPTTIHLGAFLAGGENVGCATIVSQAWNGEPGWRLRGMAVSDQLQGTGVGRKLLEALEAILVRDSADRLMWCNARTPAVPFYKRLGWTAVGTEFDIPTAGPHYVMFKRLS